jgi:hypothetical protein
LVTLDIHEILLSLSSSPLLFVFTLLASELRASCVLGSYFIARDTLPTHFCAGIFELGSCILFVQADQDVIASSKVARITSVNHRYWKKHQFSLKFFLTALEFEFCASHLLGQAL